MSLIAAENRLPLGSFECCQYIFGSEQALQAAEHIFRRSNCRVGNFQVNSRAGGSAKSERDLQGTLLLLLGHEPSTGSTKEYFVTLHDELSKFLDEFKTEKVVIRPHPRFQGRWVTKLVRYLKDSGIPVHQVTSALSLQQMVNGASVIAGVYSTALFEAHRYQNGRPVFGLWETSLIATGLEPDELNTSITWFGQQNESPIDHMKRGLSPLESQPADKTSHGLVPETVASLIQQHDISCTICGGRP